MSTDSPITIRQARLNDLDTVLELWTVLMKHHAEKHFIFRLNPDRYQSIRGTLSQRIQDPRSRMFVAEVDNLLVGLLAASLKEKSVAYEYHKTGYIAETVVLEDYRNRGIGQMLYHRVLEWFESAEVDYIELQVATNNPAADHFWERQGFQSATVHMIKPVSHENTNKET